jgi:hypothetical protein
MPESPTPPVTNSLAAAPLTAHGCAFAWACASALIAVPSLVGAADYVEPLSPEVASTHSSRLHEASPAPPFHPPKA